MNDVSTGNIRQIYLAGIMGSGKTTVGQELAAALGWTFIDLDQVIEVRAGRSIPDIFEEQGEAVFRAMETAAIQDVATMQAVVVALGGGAMERQQNRVTLLEDTAKTIWLNVSPLEAARRVAGDENRPLLAGAENVEDTEEILRNLLTDRKENYRYADLELDLSTETPAEIVTRILTETGISRDMDIHISRISPENIPYAVHVGSGLLSGTGNVLESFDYSSRAALITDANVEKLYRSQVEDSLNSSGFTVHTSTIPAGEEYKSLEVLHSLYAKFSRTGLDRKSPVIVLGGGVTGDLGGYFAASYLRGLPLVHIPTTLLAQVDSSIGGKVGVNLPAGKNLVGAFYNPDVVIADVNTLSTLPAREWYTGLGEVLKYWLIGKKEIADILRDGSENIKQHINDVVRYSIARKLEIVADDFREGGIRKFLNFGHTLGHALEKVTRYSLLTHGEAVYWGIIAALYISKKKQLLGTEEFEYCMETVQNVTFTLPQFTVDPDAVYDAIFYDKKRIHGNIHWVLLEGIGKPVIRTDVSKPLVLDAIQFAEHHVKKEETGT